jgi:hypothetical protein
LPDESERKSEPPYKVRIADSAKADYSNARLSPAQEERVKHILSTHPRRGPGVFKNPHSDKPKAEYMLEIIWGNKLCDFWYYVDEDEKTTNIVAVYSQPFGWM